jgi:hypothetical protein
MAQQISCIGAGLRALFIRRYESAAHKNKQNCDK